MQFKALYASASALVAVLCVPAMADAAPVITTVNANLLNGPISFSFMGGTFTFGGMDTFPNYINVMTSSSASTPGSVAAVRTVFGSPSTDFTNRGTVVYDANTLGGYGTVPQQTAIGATNGDNFLGLRVTANGQDYYGFAYTTNAVLNSFGFETSANTGITATTALAGAVPEAATWAMMVVGFGAIGAAMRTRKTAVRFA